MSVYLKNSLKYETDTEKLRSSSGPTVLFAHTEPGTIDVNRDLQPLRTATITADVKDFKSRITDVKLEFSKIPLEIPMKNTSGSTWKAELTPRQIEMLAVLGKTMKYEVQVIAKNEDGQISMSLKPVEVEVRAPKPGKIAG